MQLIRGIHNLKDFHHGSVLTIGNFDGVHKGHQAILKRLVECAKQYQLPATVMIFEPHPAEVFSPETAPSRLSRLREKLELLKSYGVDRVMIMKFDHQTAAMPAEDFIKKLLVEQLGVKYLIVGDDFHFGNQRQGDYELLKSRSVEFGYGLERTATLMFSAERISSTAVRTALESNNLVKAKSLLGRDYELLGKVVHGQKRGRTIGFPTANVFLHRNKCPLNGVFAVSVDMPNRPIQQHINGVANLGTRPTVNGTRLQLEVHLFKWSEDIYAQTIRVKFLDYIRSEEKFASFEHLRQQIDRDVIQAKSYFNLTNV